MEFLNSLKTRSKLYSSPFDHWELNEPLTKEEINEICIEENRDPKEIIVIAASKKQSVLSIKKAFLNGITNFGENFLQEAERKISAMGDG